jgi:hypothetical protein
LRRANSDDHSSYALPKFVELLKASPDDDSSGDYKHHQSEEINDDDDDDEAVVVRNNETVLSWKNRPKQMIKEMLELNKSSRIEQSTPRGKKERTEQMISYRLTTPSDVTSVRTLSSPLGPLIEYIAYKMEAQTELILKHLIELDKDMSLKDRSSQNYVDMVTVTPRIVYNCVMKKTSGLDNFTEAIAPSSKKRPRSPTADDDDNDDDNNNGLTSPQQRQSSRSTGVYPKINAKRDDNRRSTSNSIFHDDPLLSQYNFSDLETDLLVDRSKDQVRTQIDISENNDDTLSVGQTDWI